MVQNFTEPLLPAKLIFHMYPLPMYIYFHNSHCTICPEVFLVQNFQEEGTVAKIQPMTE